MSDHDSSSNRSGLQRRPPASRSGDGDTDPNASLEALLGQGAGDVNVDQTFVPGANDRTQVFDTNSLGRAGPSFKLLVTAGPRMGSEFALDQPVMTLGRANDNHLSVPDVSVSRKHVRFTRLGADGYTIEDLKSGNGTKVNGDQITAPRPVRNGDVITVGDTELQFVEIGAPPAARKPKPSVSDDATQFGYQAPKLPSRARQLPPPASPAKPPALGGGSKLPLVAVGLLVVALLVGLGLVAKHRRQQAEAAEAEASGAALAELEQQAKELARKGKWIEAAGTLEEVAADIEDESFDELLSKYKVEAAEQKKVLQAAAALKDGRFDVARSSASAVPETAAVYEDAQELLKKVSAEVDRSAAEARDALAAGDREKATKLVEKVLAFEPGNEAALATKAELEKKSPAPKRLPGPAVGGKQKDEGRSTSVGADSGSSAPAAGRGAIVSSYLAGDISRALQAAEDANDPLAKQFRTLDAAYRDGVAKANANRSAEAVKSLGIAARIDRDLAKGRPSKIGGDISRWLGNQEYLLGLDCKGDDQLARAAAHFVAAADADPLDLHRKARDKTFEKCRELYVQAYVGRATSPDESRRLFKVACECLPPGDDKHDRACNYYSQLGGK